MSDERIKDLADVPSFPAVYAAALLPRRGGPARTSEKRLPSTAYRVRKVRIDATRAVKLDDDT